VLPIPKNNITNGPNHTSQLELEVESLNLRNLSHFSTKIAEAKLAAAEITMGARRQQNVVEYN
jgi:hypothetical protein